MTLDEIGPIPKGTPLICIPITRHDALIAAVRAADRVVKLTTQSSFSATASASTALEGYRAARARLEGE